MPRFFLCSLLVMICVSTSAQAARPPHELVVHRFVVTATAFNSVRAQTDRSPLKGAWGDRLDRLPRGVTGIAVSRDLYRRGLKRHERLRINGMKGEFMVVDRTHRRWRNRIDICMGKDLRAARRFGKRKVEVVWLHGEAGRYGQRNTLAGGR